MTDLSPFLPGTKIQYAFDSTSLGWLKTCPRLYQYHMIEGWVGKGNSVHLQFGLWYHAALELFDKRRSQGDSWDDALATVVQSALCDTWDFVENKPWVSDHNLKTRETLIRSIIWYIDHFKDDPAETVQLANGKPAVELSFKMELDFGPRGGLLGGTAEMPQTTGNKILDGQPYILSGHLDRVVTFSGGTYVMDRKTSSSTIGSYYFDQYDPDNQMSLYTLAAKVIYNTPVKGVIIDAAQIAVGFTRFSRGLTYRTDQQLEEFLDETKWYLRRAEEMAKENYWPRNDKACHHYGGCTFRKVCSKNPEMREKFLETDFVKRQWNPLIPR